MGSMRDDGAAIIGYPNTTDVKRAVSDQDFDGPHIVKSGKFPAPDGANATLNAFNVTARVATDGEFRCLDQASAYAAVKNKLFPAVYSYEFDRSYQMAGFSPNAPVGCFISCSLANFIILTIDLGLRSPKDKIPSIW